jgi:RNA polymerase sigma factor (TIGR02999 family)
MTGREHDVTELLADWSAGDESALGRLIPMVEADLHRIAERYMRREAKNHTLQTTALLGELYLKLMGQRQLQWENRAHFYGSAARIMRRILVDHARIRDAAKRGGGAAAISLDDLTEIGRERDRELIALDEALAALARVDERQSRIVELRYFAGLGHEEVGEVLQISERTVRREWRTARLWLHQFLAPE